jgi:hypothetical protein
LELLERREKTRGRIRKASQLGAVAGGLPGLIGASYSGQYSAKIEALEKVYGRNGVKKVKKKAETAKLKDLGAVLKEEGALPEEKKEDKD